MEISEEVMELAEELAQVKSSAKKLKDLSDALTEKLISEHGVNYDIPTKLGTLAFTTRDNMEISDKIGLIKLMGQKSFNAAASVSKTSVKEQIGERGLQDILDKGYFAVKSISRYFELRKKKK